MPPVGPPRSHPPAFQRSSACFCPRLHSHKTLTHFATDLFYGPSHAAAMARNAALALCALICLAAAAEGETPQPALQPQQAVHNAADAPRQGRGQRAARQRGGVRGRAARLMSAPAPLHAQLRTNLPPPAAAAPAATSSQRPSPLRRRRSRSRNACAPPSRPRHSLTFTRPPSPCPRPRAARRRHPDAAAPPDWPPGYLRAPDAFRARRPPGHHLLHACHPPEAPAGAGGACMRRLPAPPPLQAARARARSSLPPANRRRGQS